MSDLWSFDPTTNYWAFVHGNNVQNQQPSSTDPPNNNPGGLVYMCSWLDETNSLWLFGGESVTSAINPIGYSSAVWQFNPSTNQWSMVLGGSSYGSYTPTYQIGPRSLHGCVSTDGGKTVYVSGGVGYDSSTNKG